MNVYRSGIPVDHCTTLKDASNLLGCTNNMLYNHKMRGTLGFPQPVARIGGIELYVISELKAFYHSVLWRKSNKYINHLTGTDYNG
mgnify:CR=1 FL=1|jgi:hypothetical protein